LLLDTIRNAFGQLFSDFIECAPEGYNQVTSSNPSQKSFLRLFFKKVNTKFARRLIFPDHVLLKLECNPKSDLLKLLNVHTAHGVQALNQTLSGRELKCQVRVLQRDESAVGGTAKTASGCGGQCGSEQSVAAAAVCLCLPKTTAATIKEYLHVGVGVQLTHGKRGTPFPTNGERKFVISEVSCPGPCVAHIVLEPLNPAAYVHLESFIPNTELTLHFDDPYVIDDDTIEWFKNKDLFHSKNIKMQIGRAVDDDLNELARLSSKDHQLKDVVWRKKEFVLKFSPYEHRTLIVLASIYFDACEAYRNIVSATGVEFFMDLLLVNGSANIKKWKKFGSISEVQNFREESSISAVTQPSALSTMPSKLPSDVGAPSKSPSDVVEAPSSMVVPKGPMAVVDIRIPIQTQSNEAGQRTNHIVVTIPDKKDDQLRFLQSQEGSFFSIHSTNQQAVTCTFDLTEKHTECCLCCGVTAATAKERWSPYQPGKQMQPDAL